VSAPTPQDTTPTAVFAHPAQILPIWPHVQIVTHQQASSLQLNNAYTAQMLHTLQPQLQSAAVFAKPTTIGA
jgi:hypothetical protein